jgi:hypothetical protein
LSSTSIVGMRLDHITRLNFKILGGMLSKLDIDLSVLPDRRLSAGKTSDDVTLCRD